MAELTLAPLAKAGGGNDHSGMEIRLPRLEEDMREVKIDLKALRVDVNDLRTDVAGLKGRMSGIEARLGQIPTTWQTFSFTLTLMGDVFAIVRYGVSH